MADQPPMICNICNVALQMATYDSGEVEYQHPPRVSADHDPVPVPPGPDWSGVCDFCSSENPTFVLPVHSFEVGEGIGSSGDWAACAECARMIERNDWNGVARRALARFPDGVTPEVEGALKAYHRLLRKNVRGAIRPLQS